MAHISRIRQNNGEHNGLTEHGTGLNPYSKQANKYLNPWIVERGFITARTEMEDWAMRHADAKRRYEADVDALDRERDPLAKAAQLEYLLTVKHKFFAIEYTRLVNVYGHWKERMDELGLDTDDKKLIELNAVPYWWRCLEGVNDKFHPNHEKVKGMTFIPGVQKPRAPGEKLILPVTRGGK